MDYQNEVKNKVKYMENRDISWLKFNERVLNLANDKNIPLLERLKFISIFYNNLDEFLMVRLAGLHLINICAKKKKYPDIRSGMTLAEQINEICKMTNRLLYLENKYENILLKELANRGIAIVNLENTTSNEEKLMKNYFKYKILDKIKPIIIGENMDFPYLEGKKRYIFASLENKVEQRIFAFINISEILENQPCFLEINPGRYISIENIVLKNIGIVFKEYKLNEALIIAPIRSAEINFDDEIFTEDFPLDKEDYPNKIKKMLKKRKTEKIIALECNKILPDYLKEYFSYHLKLSSSRFFTSLSSLSLFFPLSAYNDFKNSLESDFVIENTYKTFVQRDNYKGKSMLYQALTKDIMLFYPFDSMEVYFRLLKEAAFSNEVAEIKITLYRLASSSKLVDLLCLAALNGKKVSIFMELKARFSEESNLHYGERLERAGCQIFYGVEGLKLHGKASLIIFRDKRAIGQISTGNFNEETSKIYTDFSLITSNKKIINDMTLLFQNFVYNRIHCDYKNLLISPFSLGNVIIQFINREIEKEENGYICLKINSLTDVEIIEKLQEASSAGVKVDLIIRGISSLIPNVKGKTENIRIISVLGRYLEHSRVYIFGKGKDEKVYISSGDFMTRNLKRRVEIACPIFDFNIKNSIKNIVNMYLLDNTSSYYLHNNGVYVRIKNNEEKFNVQNTLECKSYF